MLKRALKNDWVRRTLIVGAAFGLFEPRFGVAQGFTEIFPQGLFADEQFQMSPIQAPPERRGRLVGFRRERHARTVGHKHRHSSASAAEPSTTHCVRLCDGRHFQLADVTKDEAQDLCASACPDASTKIFFGDAEIKDAVGEDGQKYSELPNAFVYLQRIVPGCSCRDGQLGMAAIAVDKDPTLQRGDVVITPSGPVTFRSKSQK